MTFLKNGGFLIITSLSVDKIILSLVSFCREFNPLSNDTKSLINYLYFQILELQARD